MIMAKVTMKINLSPTKTGDLYMKWSSLVKENKELKYELGQLKIHADHQSTLLASCEQALEDRDNL
jgi:regulator of replication initiation timing